MKRIFAVILAVAAAPSIAQLNEQQKDTIEKITSAAMDCVRRYAIDRAHVAATASEIADAALAICSVDLKGLQTSQDVAAQARTAEGYRDVFETLRRTAIYFVVETRAGNRID